MRVVIIEDEAKSAKELKSMLNAYDNDIDVVAILPSVSSAIAWFESNPEPELIFSDIQLGDGLSFEIFKTIKAESLVIFCTAFDEYAIKAFESNSIDYLLKPIEEEALQRSVEKYIGLKEHLSGVGQFKDNLENVVRQMDVVYRQTILVYFREKIIPIRVNDIQFIYVSNGVVSIYTQDNNQYSVQYTIEQLESMLNPKQFFRANRQFVINKDFVKNIEHYFNRKLFVATQSETPEKIIVSKLKAQAFLKWMQE